jgi:alginate O-acetyltransferase complex protein AlgI
LLLGVERFFLRWKSRTPESKPSRLRAVLGWFYTFHAVTLLWLTFLMPDLHQIGMFFEQLLIPGKMIGPAIFSSVVFGSMVVIYHVFGWLREHRPDGFNRFRGSLWESLAYGVMLFLLLTNSGAPQGFIYFQF